MTDYESGNPYQSNYSQGGGGSGGGGGGFMGGSQDQSQSAGGAKDSNNTSLRPVTIRQILNASSEHADATFVIDGHEVGAVTFVAVVRTVRETQTNINFTVEDGTGQIECVHWIDASEEDHVKIQENQYARFVGPVKGFQNKRSIRIANVHPIEDHNEVFFHKLDVMYTHLKLTKGAGGGGGGQSGGVLPSRGRLANPPSFNSWPKVNQELWGIMVQDVRDGAEETDLKAAVGRLNNKYDLNTILEAAETLTNEGLAYETQDHVLTIAE